MNTPAPYSDIAGFFEGLRPEAGMQVSEWADKHRFLAATSSAEPGQWRTARTPYLKEIMDMLSVNNLVQDVIVMKGAQLGFTEAGCNWIGYVIDVAPGPFLAVQPTESTMKRNSRMRIEPMIEATPRLRKKVSPARTRDSGNTLLQKEFPGGILIMAGANSGSALRSMPIRFLFLDEVDAYPMDLDGEGSPIDLAKARTRTFARRKVYTVSTPTVESQSAIANEFAGSDQRYYFVPCPHCGVMETLKFGQLKWTKGSPETVIYECEHCEQAIEEREKGVMLENGEWRVTVPANISSLRVGYHINSLYSPAGWFTWQDIARQWEEAQTSVLKLKTFVNTVLAEVWKEKGESPPWEMLYSRRERYEIGSVPAGVSFLTCGVDVQRDRLELEIVGWGKGKRSWSIEYRVILGDTADTATWDKLGLVLNETWTRTDGAQFTIRSMAVDTGYNTSHCYAFCRRYQAPRVIAVKGSDSVSVIVTPPRAVSLNVKGKKVKSDVKVWIVGVSIVKQELYGWLKLMPEDKGETPPGFCHFPEYDQNYFRGITAEKHQYTKTKKGYAAYVWVKHYDRNEPLDCRVYARAGATVLGIDRFTDAHYDFMAGTATESGAAPAPVKRKKRSGGFLDRD